MRQGSQEFRTYVLISFFADCLVCNAPVAADGSRSCKYQSEHLAPHSSKHDYLFGDLRNNLVVNAAILAKARPAANSTDGFTI